MRAFRIGIRWIINRPIASLMSAVCVATGIGACAVAWTLVDEVILRPHGLVDTRELVVVWETDPARSQPLIEVSFPNFLDWQREARTVQRMAAFGSQHWPALARIRGETLPLAARAVSVDFFPVLGVQPTLGRNFEAADAAPSNLPPVVLSQRFWRTHFGGSTDIVGHRLFIDGTDHTIVGVMPAGFAYPDDPDVWVSVERVLGEAFQEMPVTQQRAVGVLEVVARRHDDASVGDVRAELTHIIQALQKQYFPNAGGTTRGADVTPFADAVIGRLGTRLWIAAGMAVAVWLLACANVAAVRAAHLGERAAELAARLFLGATRAQLARELAVESIPLAIAGGVLAAAVWSGMLDLLGSSRAIADSGIALDVNRLHGAGVIVLLGVASWIAVGVLPAVLLARQNIAIAQQTPARVALPVSRVGAPLLGGQAVLAIGVVALAAVSIQTFARLSRIDLGFATHGVTLVDFSIPDWKYESPAAARTLVERLGNAVRELPQATRVAAVSVRPFRFGEIVEGLPVRRATDALAQPAEAADASRVVVTPDYFAAMGQPLVDGRAFTSADRADTEPVAILSRTLARALFGDRPAIGERIETYTLSEKWSPRLIVGIAGDAQYRGLERPSMEVYVPHTQVNSSLGSLVIATTGPFGEASVREQLRRVEPELAIERVQTTGDLARSILSPARLLTMVVSILGGAGLLLLTLGVFGAAATAVRAAWREIAVRQAIGAMPFQAARAPLVTLSRALGCGVAVGLLLTPALLSGAAFLGLEASESLVPPLIAAASAVLVAAVLAVAPSVWRAAHATPADLLRAN